MAQLVERSWQASFEAPSRRARRGGAYRAYVPDPLTTRPVLIGADLAERAAGVERLVQGLSHQPAASALEGLARFLLRSEAIASSRIEGLQASAQQVGLAEFLGAEGMPQRSATPTARAVANNIVTLRQAATQLADAPAVTVEGICELRRALLPGERHDGLREVQNWIGGSDWHPLDAEFVPPPPDHVLPLVVDLAEYISGGVHAPLVQAAFVHAQFETIHPFTDGNGRVGRALIHTVLTRRGLTRAAVLPISLVLLTRADAYISGLTHFRYAGSADMPAAQRAGAAWLTTFLDAVEVAVDQATRFVRDLDELRVDWADRLAAWRVGQGLRPAPQAGSAVARLQECLAEAPVMTAGTVGRLLGVSVRAALSAVEELADAGILHRKSLDRGTTGYLARDVFDLLTIAERAMASTKWDTRESAPNRPVPARPE